nr:YibE/F family protein [Synergistales bacterium]
LGGCVSALVFGWGSIFMLRLSGLSTATASLLASTVPGIDLRGILLASIIIGASGAVLDVAVSVTSAMAEMKDHDPGIEARVLFQSGINVGKEVLGSMVNTLVFAYFGNSLVLSLLILEAEPIPIAMLNDSVIAEEVIRALAGTAGLLLTIPLTALFGALMMSGGSVQSGEG